MLHHWCRSLFQDRIVDRKISDLVQVASKTKNLQDLFSICVQLLEMAKWGKMLIRMKVGCWTPSALQMSKWACWWVQWFLNRNDGSNEHSIDWRGQLSRTVDWFRELRQEHRASQRLVSRVPGLGMRRLLGKKQKAIKDHSIKLFQIFVSNWHKTINFWILTVERCSLGILEGWTDWWDNAIDDVSSVADGLVGKVGGVFDCVANQTTELGIDFVNQVLEGGYSRKKTNVEENKR